ncbi:MAG: ATP-binding cassette domain-containing protein [Acidobacteriota bacterium]
MPILKVQDLRKSFPVSSWNRRFIKDEVSASTSEGRTIAVDGVSFSIYEGETLGLVGESGCGKSTLARCILRLIEPTAGRIEFFGEDLLALSGRRLRRARRRMGAVFQDPFSSLNPRMKVSGTIEEPLIIHALGNRRRRRDRVFELLTLVGLQETDADRLPSEFSGGQRQRIAIARALANAPELFIADEPVSALDLSIQNQIISLLKKLKDELGMSMFLVSHSLPVVRQLCDRVAVMRQGRILELAETEVLFSTPAHPYTRQLLDAVPEPDPRLQRQKARARQGLN